MNKSRQWWIRDNAEVFGVPADHSQRYVVFDRCEGVEGPLIHVVEKKLEDQVRLENYKVNGDAVRKQQEQEINNLINDGLKAGITLKAIADRKEELLSALKSAAVTLKEIQAQGVCSGSLKNLLDGTLEFSKKVIGDEE